MPWEVIYEKTILRRFPHSNDRRTECDQVHSASTVQSHPQEILNQLLYIQVLYFVSLGIRMNWIQGVLGRKDCNREDVRAANLDNVKWQGEGYLLIMQEIDL
jgi:hypothetical protein